jgi:hypothetical protein
VGRSDPTTLTVTLTQGTEPIGVGRAASQQCDVALVDVLLRLSIAAKRLGWTVHVDGADDDLRELCAFLGLGELLAFASVLEPGRQPEGGEERGVEEVVDPGDPPA